MSLRAFTAAYIEAALFSTNDESDDSGGEPLDKNYGPSDISEETMRQIELDCAAFYGANESIWADQYIGRAEGTEDEQAGHDFWFTRGGHGVGFWDGDWEEPAATQLSEAAEEFGEFWLTVGDDGEIHGSPLSDMARSTAMAGGSGLGAVSRGLGFWNPKG